MGINNFNEVRMSAEVYINRWDKYCKNGDRFTIFIHDDGRILGNDGNERVGGYIELSLSNSFKQRIIDYYKKSQVPLEAVITSIKSTGGGLFMESFQYEFIVYFPTMNDNRINSWRCNSCGTENDGLFCRHCGEKRRLNTDYWICPKCGKKIDNQDNFCGICGSANPHNSNIYSKSKTEHVSSAIKNESTNIPKNNNRKNMLANKSHKLGLHNEANTITGGIHAEECTELFNQGVELKREGKYVLAIKKELEAISIYPDSPDLSQLLMGLGKTFYLAGLFEKSRDAYALSCYRTFNNPSNIINGQPSFSYRLSAIHYGHAIMDKNTSNEYIENYKMAISGKSIAMLGLSAYDEMCIKKGMEFVCTLYEKYRSGRAKSEYETLYYRTIRI